MLFMVSWDFIDTSEAGDKRSLEVFGRWQPPEGADFQAFYGFADNSGGVAIIEVDSAATLARTTAPIRALAALRQRKPILPIEESAAIAQRGDRVPRWVVA